MSFAANGTFSGQVEGLALASINLTNTAVGDLILLAAMSVDSPTNYVNGISGGGATWTQIGTHVVAANYANKVATLWQGTVTATGAQTATLSLSGGSPTIACVWQEFSSTVGSWTVDASSIMDSTGAAAWPTLTPSGTGELYFGFNIDHGNAIAGSTPGYTYKVTANNDGCAWNTNVSAASAPVWGDSGEGFGPVVLIKESIDSGSGGATLPKMKVSGSGRVGSVFTVFGQTGGDVLASDNAAYTMGMQFTVSQSVALTGIWWYSPSGTSQLPSQCGVYQVTSGTNGNLIASNTSATWSGAAGSGWVRCAFDGSVTLTPGNNYEVVVYSAYTGPWYAGTAHYWDTGAGASGVTSGPLSAPSNTGVTTTWGTGGQDMFITPSTGGLAYPHTAFNATNYWVDVEVTTSGGSDSGTGSVTLPKMRVSGVGVLGTGGTVAIILPKMTLSGAGIVFPPETGTGSVTIPKMRVTSSGYTGNTQVYAVVAVMKSAWNVAAGVSIHQISAWNVGQPVQGNIAQLAKTQWISTYPS